MIEFANSLLKTLYELGLLDNLVKLIMLCLSSNNMRIL